MINFFRNHQDILESELSTKLYDQNTFYKVFIKGLHRKVVVIDREILYEGSLNILSQNNSIEMMRRIESVNMCWRLARFMYKYSF